MSKPSTKVKRFFGSFRDPMAHHRSSSGWWWAFRGDTPTHHRPPKRKVFIGFHEAMLRFGESPIGSLGEYVKMVGKSTKTWSRRPLSWWLHGDESIQYPQYLRLAVCFFCRNPRMVLATLRFFSVKFHTLHPPVNSLTYSPDSPHRIHGTGISIPTCGCFCGKCMHR